MSTYLEAGVNLSQAARWVDRLKAFSPSIGGFGGVYPLGENDLIASTDGVGTKIKLAVQLGNHATIGIDLVAMNVNDILTYKAQPLFFLDYLAVSKLELHIVEQIVAGVLQGCAEAGCLLIGGETAQMSEMYSAGEYDMAGFAVGIVKRSERCDPSHIAVGDVIVGLSSSGVHSNGFSLVRSIIKGDLLHQKFDGEVTLGEALLRPTKIYVKQIQRIMERFTIRGMAHITGGSFAKNIPRMLPKGLTACLDKGSWPILPIFSVLQEIGSVSTEEMYRVFNMGIGFVLVLSPEEARTLCQAEPHCFAIGEVMEGTQLTWK